MVHFKIKHSTQMKKLMTAFSEQRGLPLECLQFQFGGVRLEEGLTPMDVRTCPSITPRPNIFLVIVFIWQFTNCTHRYLHKILQYSIHGSMQCVNDILLFSLKWKRAIQSRFFALLVALRSVSSSCLIVLVLWLLQCHSL